MKIKNLKLIFCTVTGVTTGVGSAYLLSDYLKPLKASWTTSYEPSVKWDHNWDRYSITIKEYFFC